MDPDRINKVQYFNTHLPRFPGAHSLDELNENIKEVIEMLLDDAEFLSHKRRLKLFDQA